MEENKRVEEIKVGANKKIRITTKIGIKDAKSRIEHIQEVSGSKMEGVTVGKENTKTSIIT